jgi:hypothetical protein
VNVAILPLRIRPQDWGIIAKRVQCKQSEGNSSAAANDDEKRQVSGE